MNTELIRLSRKAAKEFDGIDGYSQASQLINALLGDDPQEEKNRRARGRTDVSVQAHAHPSLDTAQN